MTNRDFLVRLVGKELIYNGPKDLKNYVLIGNISFDDSDEVIKVHIFWEGHKILRNLHLTFDYSTYSQKLGEDFAKLCGLLRIYEL